MEVMISAQYSLVAYNDTHGMPWGGENCRLSTDNFQLLLQPFAYNIYHAKLCENEHWVAAHSNNISCRLLRL